MLDWAVILSTSLGLVSVLGVILHPLLVGMRNRERQRDRELLLQLTKEKLDVLRSAITAGYDEEQMKLLDSRLERLLGQQQFRDLIEHIGTYEDAQGQPVIDTPLLSQELASDGAGPDAAAARQQKVAQ